MLGSWVPIFIRAMVKMERRMILRVRLMGMMILE